VESSQIENLGIILFFFVILFIITAIASASEMALSSVSRIRLKAKAEAGDKKARELLKMVEDYDRSITSVVVLNNIINILLPAISLMLFVSVVGEQYGFILSTVVMTLLILIFGEIIPKIYGKESNEKYLYTVLPFLKLVRFLFYPLVKIFLSISSLFKKFIVKEVQEEDNILEDELLTIIEESKEEGQLKESEEELIRNAIEFNDTRVEEILQPKSSMTMISSDSDNQSVYMLLKEERYSRVPVYENDTDNIIGIISEREFLVAYVEDKEFDLKDTIRDVIFIPDTLKISKLLPELQAKHIHMAIVVDERGTVQGLVTVEDILEELVGEIWDEHDDVAHDVRKLSDNVYEVVGELSIDDFNDLFDVKDISSSHSETTIAGYILELAERIPISGDKFFDDNFKYVVSEMDGNKIEKIKVIKLGDNNEKE
jgi:CBS domain containing-hemolysin-like protein